MYMYYIFDIYICTFYTTNNSPFSFWRDHISCIFFSSLRILPRSPALIAHLSGLTITDLYTKRLIQTARKRTSLSFKSKI